jgi:hypothetical protein
MTHTTGGRMLWSQSSFQRPLEYNTTSRLLKGSLSSSDGEATPTTLDREKAEDSHPVGLRCLSTPKPQFVDNSPLVECWVGDGSESRPRLEVGVGRLSTLRGRR